MRYKVEALKADTETSANMQAQAGYLGGKQSPVGLERWHHCKERRDTMESVKTTEE